MSDLPRDLIYAVTLTGSVRHIFSPLPPHLSHLPPGVLMPPDAVALCGRRLNCEADKVDGADELPVCQLCATRGKAFR